MRSIILVGDLTVTKTETEPKIALQILDEANRYHMDKVSETQLNIDKFQQLLPQYEQNPDGITEQMYYDMLEKVPGKKDEYTLLNSKLSDLLLKNNITTTSKDIGSAPTRDFSRSVKNNQERNLNGR